MKIAKGFQVTERTRFVTDRRTDGQTDGPPGKNNMSPNPEGGRYNEVQITWTRWPQRPYEYMIKAFRNLLQNQKSDELGIKHC